MNWMAAAEVLADGESSFTWPEESRSRVSAAWQLAPPLASVSGDDLARALLHCGWHFDDGDEGQVCLERDGRAVTIPRVESLDPDRLAALAVEANMGPLALVAALEKTLIPSIEVMLTRLRPGRPAR